MEANLKIFKRFKVLFAEDDQKVLNAITYVLEMFFDEVFMAKDGQEAYRLFEEYKPDLIITDIKMPIMDGLDLVKKIRTVDYETPIVLISSYSDQSLLLKALNLGVDGYIIKPIELDDLIKTCLKAVKRKDRNIDISIVELKNGLIYDLVKKELRLNGTIVELGAKERSLLGLFIRNNDKTLSKEDIVGELWPLDEITDSAIKSLLSRLRGKIGDDVIVNIKGSGWRLEIGD